MPVEHKTRAICCYTAYCTLLRQNAGRDTMIDAPSRIDQEQLDELGVKVIPAN